MLQFYFLRKSSILCQSRQRFNRTTLLLGNQPLILHMFKLFARVHVICTCPCYLHVSKLFARVHVICTCPSYLQISTKFSRVQLFARVHVVCTCQCYLHVFKLSARVQVICTLIYYKSFCQRRVLSICNDTAI